MSNGLANVDDSFMDVSGFLCSVSNTESNEDRSSDSSDEDEDPEDSPEHVETKYDRIRVIYPGKSIPLAAGQIFSTVMNNLSNRKNSLVEYAAEEQRRLTLLTSVLAYACRDETVTPKTNSFNLPPAFLSEAGLLQRVPVPIMTPSLSSTKIIYATKSFDEITEVVKILKKFKHTGYLQFFELNVIGSHTQLCRKFAKRNVGESSCSPDTVTSFQFIEKSEGIVHSLRDLRKAAKQNKFCSYFFCKQQVQKANFILCPQEILLSPFWRSIYGLDLKNAVILFDDGQNIEKLCYDEGSLSVSTVTIQAAATNLETCINAKENEFGPVQILENLAVALKKFANRIELDYKSETAITIQTIRESGFDQSSSQVYLTDFQRLYNFMEAAGSDTVTLEEKTISKITKLLVNIVRLFICHSKTPLLKQFTIEVSHFKPKYVVPETIHYVFHIINNDPRVILEPLLNEMEPCLISSGCLPPIDVFGKELGEKSVKFGDAAIMERQEATQCFFAYVNSGPNKVKFEFEMRDRARDTIHAEAGEAILQLCRVVPKGVIVLFAARAVLDLMKTRWEDDENRPNTILDDIKKVKHIFWENPDAKYEDTKRDLDKFTELCEEPMRDKTGAVFFALHRGKVRKIMDFKRGEVRMFVVCQLPYDSMVAKHVKAKKEYHNNENQFKRWYNAEMFHMVNRTVAHCVGRGQNWVSAVILDQRILDRKNQLDTFIPSWIRQDMRGYRNFKKMRKDLESFVQQQNQQQE